jgi:hypothetical protein
MKTPPFFRTTIDHLTKLSEAELVKRVVEPLLRAEGYNNVRITGGSNDRGKDLTALKDDFGRTKLYGIQVKRIHFTGRHDDVTAGLYSALIQMSQVFSEPVEDPSTKTYRHPDRCLFITPYSLSVDAIRSAFHKFREMEQKEVTIIDGPILIDLILKHDPSIIEEFDMDLPYRYRLAEAMNLINESSVFDLGRTLELKKIYVDLGLSDDVLSRLAIGVVGEIVKPKVISCTNFELTSLNAVAREWTDIPIVPLLTRDGKGEKAIREALALEEIGLQHSKDEIKRKIDHRHFILSKQGHTINEVDTDKELSALRVEEEILNKTSVQYVDIQPVVTQISQRAKLILEKLATLKPGPSDLTDFFQSATQIRNKIDDFRHNDSVRKNWREFADLSPGETEGPVIPPRSLLSIKMPLFIRGPAGAGKTTLLRFLCQQNDWRENSENTPLPIIFHLIRVQITSEQDILDHSIRQLRNFGRSISPDEFEIKLKKGSFRLLFDGLDEAGERADEVFAHIKAFGEKFKASGPIVTGRDTFQYSEWREAAHLQLLPFSNSQLDVFIGRWFDSRPSKAVEVKNWLRDHPGMRKTGRTPIIAALICSLCDADVELPSTEIDLYDQRFELLLGKWEKAKGAIPLLSDLRKRYWLFLMKVAFANHLEGTRTISHERVIKFAESFFEKRYHGSAANLVKDCVHRGILAQELGTELSFGHLTYQEFLVAKHLASENSLDVILHRLENPWWRKTLEYFAALKGDLTSLSMYALSHRCRSKQRDIILELTRHARFTPDETKIRLIGANSNISPMSAIVGKSKTSHA